MVSKSASAPSPLRHCMAAIFIAAVLALSLPSSANAAESKEYAINPAHDDTIVEDVLDLAKDDDAIDEEVLSPHAVDEWDKPLPTAGEQVEASNATTRTITIGEAVRIALENTRRETPRAEGTPPSQSENLYTLFFNVRQDIFVGFRNLSNLLRSRFAEEQAKLNRYNEELSLLLSVQENFLNLLRAREDVRSAQDSVTRLESQLKVTRAFYDVGLRPRLDVLQAEVDLADAEDTLLQAENSVAVQLARLNTLLPLHLGDDVEYVGELRSDPFPLSLKTCLERAYKNRPDLLIFKKAVDIARQDSRVAASSLYPQIQGEFSWSQFGDTPALRGSPYTNLNRFDQWSLEIGLNWELFDFGENLFTWRQARESEKGAQADVASQYLEATYDVKSRRLQIDETAKRIAVAQKRVEQGKEGYRMAVARYQAQVGTNNDVLDAQSRLTSAESTLTDALVNYQIAVASLYVAIGAKNVDLKLTQE
ncbi:MAG: TolC family protein [Oceanidesulfovibrio sp.]